MYRDPARNPDGRTLALDHTHARAQGGTTGDRLLLATCNESRGDGTRGAVSALVTATFTRPKHWTRTWFDVPDAPLSSGTETGHVRLVVLLCGPPGAGKTTAACESGLTIYDRDDEQWTSERQFTDALTQLGADPHARAVVIRTAASSAARARAAALCQATYTYLLTADPAELGHRIARRGRADRTATLAAVRTWFERFDRDDDVPDFEGWHVLDLAEASR